MKYFLITVKIDDPYPKKFSYRTTGTSFITGVARALREFRKDFKGRKIKEGDLHFQYLGTQKKELSME